MANEARFHHQSVHNENATQMCSRGMQTKGSLFSFHTFPKDSSRRKLHPWGFELEIVQSRLPCGHPHTHEFFTKEYRSRISRLSLSWSLVEERNGLFGWNHRPCQFYKEYIQTDQRTQKYILTPWHPVQRLKLEKGKSLFHKKPPEKEGSHTPQKEANVHTNPQQEWTQVGRGGKTIQRYEIDKLSRHKHTRAHTLPHTRTNQTMNNFISKNQLTIPNFTCQEAPTSFIVANDAEPCAIHIFVEPRLPLAQL